jgi:hypothetical protein
MTLFRIDLNWRNAQRFALLALGRVWTLLESRKNPKPEKCLKMPQNPQRPVHAMLGGNTIYHNLILLGISGMVHNQFDTLTFETG